MTAAIVSGIYSPPQTKRTPDFVFVVRCGSCVRLHRHSTREAAEADRAKMVATRR